MYVDEYFHCNDSTLNFFSIYKSLDEFGAYHSTKVKVQPQVQRALTRALRYHLLMESSLQHRKSNLCSC